jgi:hypothetical protein
VPGAVIAEARRLARRSPKTGERRSLRVIAAELAALGHFGPSGQPYLASSIRHMLAGQSQAFMDKAPPQAGLIIESLGQHQRCDASGTSRTYPR